MIFPQNKEAKIKNRHSARCGKHTERKMTLRNVRKPHFSLKHDSALCGKQDLNRNGLPRFAERRFLPETENRILRNAGFCLGELPHGAESTRTKIYLFPLARLCVLQSI